MTFHAFNLTQSQEELQGNVISSDPTNDMDGWSVLNYQQVYDYEIRIRCNERVNEEPIFPQVINMVQLTEISQDPCFSKRT
jgi:hypothetical protein